MQRTLLKYDSIHQVVGSSELSIVNLVDEHRQRMLSVVCDADMTSQLLMRFDNPELCKTLLPEVLLKMLPSNYELMIVGIFDGQYQVLLMDTVKGESVRVRMSDAVLLSIISDIPLYAENNLLKVQSVPYNESVKGVAIPINTMDMERLKLALDKAIAEENYELASHLRDEIERRKNIGK